MAKRGGQNKYEPSQADRNTVISMAACGFAHEAIARCIGTNGIDDKTLRKHFRRELDTAMDQANATVANKAYQLASTGAVPALTIFWLKTRLGWKEVDRHEVSGPGGAPLEMNVNASEILLSRIAGLASRINPKSGD